MTIKLSLLAILLASTSFCFAQNVDTVELKDGSIVRGTIIEYMWRDHVTIKTEEGNLHTFTSDKLKAVNPSTRQTPSAKNKGYFNHTSTGVLVGFDTRYYSPVSFALNMVNGYQINPHFAVGIGTGLNFFDSFLYVPVYGDVRYYLKDAEHTPYLSLFGGYEVSTVNDDGDNYYWGYNGRDYHGGPMVGGEIGIRNFTKDNFGVTFSIGYQYQRLHNTYDEYFWNGVDQLYLPVSEVQSMHRIKLGIGVFFQ